MMQFGHVEVFVRDVDASRAFWVDAFGAVVEDVQHGGRIVWLRLGDGTLMLRPFASGAGGPAASGTRYALGGRGTGIALYTDDLPAALARLAACGVHPVGDDGPGCPTFLDPDGNWVQLVDPRHA